MPLCIREAMNIFPGDGTSDASLDRSKHLTLESLSLPTLEEKSTAFHAGGSMFEIEFGGLGLKALTCSFKLKGSDPQTISLLGLNSPQSTPYTIYGLIRDKSDGTAKELKAILRGRLVKVAPSEFKRGDVDDQDHEIKE